MTLQTPRTLVRPFTPEDAAALHRILSDPAVMEYLEPPFTFVQTQAFLLNAGLCSPPRVYAVQWRNTGQLIGHVIYHPYDPDSFELGWVLDRAFWNRGIAAELTDHLIAQARVEQRTRLVLECVPAQAATARIAKKAGFSYVRTLDGLDVYELYLN
mgnify:CR=1 FL=1